MKYGALSTYKSTEGYVSVRTSVVLAVNAESVKLVLVNFQVEIRSLLS